MGKHRVPRSEEHRASLRKQGFQPGVSGNPKGRPTEDDALKRQLRADMPIYIDKIKDIALNGKVQKDQLKALETIFAYIMPKAAVKHEVDVQVTHVSDLLARAAKAREAIQGVVIETQAIEAIRQDETPSL